MARVKMRLNIRLNSKFPYLGEPNLKPEPVKLNKF
jgi:hypothetical protein